MKKLSSPEHEIKPDQLKEELDRYLKQKLRLLEVENGLIMQRARDDFAKAVEERKEDVLQIIEERTRQSEQEALEKREKVKTVVANFFDKAKGVFSKKLSMKRDEK